MVDWYIHSLEPGLTHWTSHGDGGDSGPAVWTAAMWHYFLPAGPEDGFSLANGLESGRPHGAQGRFSPDRAVALGVRRSGRRERLRGRRGAGVAADGFRSDALLAHRAFRLAKRRRDGRVRVPDGFREREPRARGPGELYLRRARPLVGERQLPLRRDETSQPGPRRRLGRGHTGPARVGGSA